MIETTETQPALDLEPAPVTKARMIWLREQVGALSARVGDLDARIARYDAEKIAGQEKIARARLGDDESARAALREHVDLLATEVRCLHHEASPLRGQLAVLSDHLAAEEGKLAMARRVVEDARSMGTAAPRWRNESLLRVNHLIAQAKARLADAGEAVDLETLPIGPPRYPGGGVKST